MNEISTVQNNRARTSSKWIALSPTRTTVISRIEASDFENEFESFEEFLRNNGLREKIIIGRYDPIGGAFDFRVKHYSSLDKTMVLQIVYYFVKRGFLIDKNWSEVWAIEFIEQNFAYFKHHDGSLFG